MPNDTYLYFWFTLYVLEELDSVHIWDQWVPVRIDLKRRKEYPAFYFIFQIGQGLPMGNSQML